MADEIEIFDNYLVPKQEIATEEEKQQLLNKFNISLKQLPRIKHTDPVAKKLGAKEGDIIKVTRDSPTAGNYIHYRLVI